MAKKKFTQLPDKLKFPPKFKGKLSSIYSDIVTYVLTDYDPTNQYRQSVLSIMNSICYKVIEGDTIPTIWKSSDPFKHSESILVDDEDLLEERLGELYLHVSEVEFDTPETALSSSFNHTITDKMKVMAQESTDGVSVSKQKSNTQKDSTLSSINKSAEVVETPKEHLYIQPPRIPQFDINKPFMRKVVNGTLYTIYTSLPEIPTNQSQISVTTDSSRMTDADFMHMFPHQFIRTRSATMYEEHPGLTLDSDVGILLHIDGFTDEQVKDNIVRYPHIFKLKRFGGKQSSSFYTHIEIDGVLYDTLEIWDSLPDSKYMPKNSEFIKEYVVRRYLLERDILGVNHKFPMFGDLSPFLTLFTTPSDYARLGYSNSLQLAKDCVESRIRYKQSRNPILRAVNVDA